MIQFPSAKAIRELREAESIGLFEANSRLTRQSLLNAVSKASTIDEIREVLAYVVAHADLDR